MFLKSRENHPTPALPAPKKVKAFREDSILGWSLFLAFLEDCPFLSLEKEKVPSINILHCKDFFFS